MFASDKTKPNKKISRRKLDQFRKSIESWEKMGEKESRDGDAELAEMHAEDVADLRSILRFIETGAFENAAEAIYDLDTMASDQIPDDIYYAIVPGN